MSKKILSPKMYLLLEQIGDMPYKPYLYGLITGVLIVTIVFILI